MPEIAKYVHVKSLGTALMLEVIREKNLPVGKIVVAPRRRFTAKARPTARSTGSSFPPSGRSSNCAAATGGPLPALRRGHHKRADAGERAGRRRNRLRLDESRSGKARPALGKADGYPDRRAALLLHLRPAAIDFQSLHRRDRDFLHPPAQRSSAGALRRWRTDTRFFLRRRHRAGESARGRTDKLDGLPVNVGSGAVSPIREIAEQISERSTSKSRRK